MPEFRFRRKKHQSRRGSDAEETAKQSQKLALETPEGASVNEVVRDWDEKEENGIDKRSSFIQEREKFLELLKTKYPEQANSLAVGRDSNEHEMDGDEGLKFNDETELVNGRMSVDSDGAIGLQENKIDDDVISKGETPSGPSPIKLSSRYGECLYLRHGMSLRHCPMPSPITLSTIKNLYINMFELSPSLLESPSLQIYVQDKRTLQWNKLENISLVVDHCTLLLADSALSHNSSMVASSNSDINMPLDDLTSHTSHNSDLKSHGFHSNSEEATPISSELAFIRNGLWRSGHTHQVQDLSTLPDDLLLQKNPPSLLLDSYPSPITPLSGSSLDDNRSSLIANQKILSKARHLQRTVDSLKTELSSLKQAHKLKMAELNTSMSHTAQRISTAVSGFVRIASLRGVGKADMDEFRRERLNLYGIKDGYTKSSETIFKDLYFLDHAVDELRVDVVKRRCKVVENDINTLTTLLHTTTQSLTELKAQYPPLENKLKRVMEGELQVIVQEEKFIEDEGPRLEEAKEKCDNLMKTLLTMTQYASLQSHRTPLVPIFHPVPQPDRTLLMENISAIVPNYEDRMASLETAELLRHKKKQLHTESGNTIKQFENLLRVKKQELRKAVDGKTIEEKQQMKLKEFYMEEKLKRRTSLVGEREARRRTETERGDERVKRKGLIPLSRERVQDIRGTRAVSEERQIGQGYERTHRTQEYLPTEQQEVGSVAINKEKEKYKDAGRNQEYLPAEEASHDRGRVQANSASIRQVGQEIVYENADRNQEPLSTGRDKQVQQQEVNSVIVGKGRQVGQEVRYEKTRRNREGASDYRGQVELRNKSMHSAIQEKRWNVGGETGHQQNINPALVSSPTKKDTRRWSGFQQRVGYSKDYLNSDLNEVKRKSIGYTGEFEDMSKFHKKIRIKSKESSLQQPTITEGVANITEGVANQKTNYQRDLVSDWEKDMAQMDQVASFYNLSNSESSSVNTGDSGPVARHHLMISSLTTSSSSSSGNECLVSSETSRGPTVSPRRHLAIEGNSTSVPLHQNQDNHSPRNQKSTSYPIKEKIVVMKQPQPNGFPLQYTVNKYHHDRTDSSHGRTDSSRRTDSSHGSSPHDPIPARPTVDTRASTRTKASVSESQGNVSTTGPRYTYRNQDSERKGMEPIQSGSKGLSQNFKNPGSKPSQVTPELRNGPEEWSDIFDSDTLPVERRTRQGSSKVPKQSDKVNCTNQSERVMGNPTSQPSRLLSPKRLPQGQSLLDKNTSRNQTSGHQQSKHPHPHNAPQSTSANLQMEDRKRPSHHKDEDRGMSHGNLQVEGQKRPNSDQKGARGISRGNHQMEGRKRPNSDYQDDDRGRFHGNKRISSDYQDDDGGRSRGNHQVEGRGRPNNYEQRPIPSKIPSMNVSKAPKQPETHSKAQHRPHPSTQRSGIPMRVTKSAQIPFLPNDVILTSYPRSHTAARQMRSASNGIVRAKPLHPHNGTRPNYIWQDGQREGGVSWTQRGLQYSHVGVSKEPNVIGSLV